MVSLAYQEITALRKSGQLQQAAALAHLALQDFPTDLWLRRAAAWVYYDYLKQAVYHTDLAEVEHWYLQLKAVCLPPDEDIFWHAVWHQMGEMVVRLGQQNKYNLIEAVVSLTTTLPIAIPSPVYSLWLTTVLIGGKQWSGLINFIINWDLANLIPDDYQPDQDAEISLAEQAHIALAHAVLADYEQPTPQHDYLIPTCLQLLKQLSTHYTDYHYVPFYITKLLICQSAEAEAIARAETICNTNPKAYWAWRNLAECYAEIDNDLYISHLEQAILVATSDMLGSNDADKIGPTRLTLAEAYLTQGRRAEAATVLRDYKAAGSVENKRFNILAGRCAGW